MNLEELRSFVFNELHFCGCGEPEKAMQYLVNILQALKTRGEDWNDENNKKVNELLPEYGCEPKAAITLYLLDGAGLIEHGSSIGGSWLTSEGHAFLEDMQRVGIEAVFSLD